MPGVPVKIDHRRKLQFKFKLGQELRPGSGSLKVSAGSQKLSIDQIPDKDLWE